MNREEALTVLGLDKTATEEEIIKTYKKKYCNTYREGKFKGEDRQLVNEKLAFYNKALMSLDNSSLSVPLSDIKLQLNLGVDLTNFNGNLPSNFDIFPEFERLLEKITQLIEHENHGLAIRLLEIGIQKSYRLNRYKNFTGQKRLIKTLGKLLIDVGITQKGVELMTAGSINYYIGKTYYEIKNYHSAIKYFGRELQDRKAKVSSEDIIINIARCYFLLGEYTNCLHVIERVLPNFDSTKKREWQMPEKISKMLLCAIAKEENLSSGVLIKFKLKLKYPVSYKCINMYLDSFKDGLSFLDGLKNESLLKEFTSTIQPQFEILRSVNMEYSIPVLNESYYEVFHEAMNASQLYNKN